MTATETSALKDQFRREFFRYLEDDARNEGYEVDFETEFATWLENREA